MEVSPRPIPPPHDDDDEDVHWALSTANALWGRGEREEALRWLRKAAEHASDANADMRALELFKAAAEVATKLSPSPSAAPPPAPPSAAPPPLATPPPPPPAHAMPPARSNPPARPPTAPPDPQGIARPPLPTGAPPPPTRAPPPPTGAPPPPPRNVHPPPTRVRSSASLAAEVAAAMPAAPPTTARPRQVRSEHPASAPPPPAARPPSAAPARPPSAAPASARRASAQPAPAPPPPPRETHDPARQRRADARTAAKLAAPVQAAAPQAAATAAAAAARRARAAEPTPAAQRHADARQPAYGYGPVIRESTEAGPAGSDAPTPVAATFQVATGSAPRELQERRLAWGDDEVTMQRDLSSLQPEMRDLAGFRVDDLDEDTRVLDGDPDRAVRATTGAEDTARGGFDASRVAASSSGARAREPQPTTVDAVAAGRDAAAPADGATSNDLHDTGQGPAAAEAGGWAATGDPTQWRAPPQARPRRPDALPAVRVAVLGTSVPGEVRLVPLDDRTEPPTGAALAILVPLTAGDGDAIARLFEGN